MATIPIDSDNQDNFDHDLPPDQNAAQAVDRDEECQKLKVERDSLFERLARATAEFKNAQKRGQIEMDQRLQYANSALIKSLLPVIDNFERALAVEPEKVDARTILKGMQIVHDQWLSVLKQQQVQEIAPAPGTPFDPSKHEAIMQQDSTYKTPTVVQLLQKGYSLHDRTLRPRRWR